jgi:hypothetical protein
VCSLTTDCWGLAIVTGILKSIPRRLQMLMTGLELCESVAKAALLFGELRDEPPHLVFVIQRYSRESEGTFPKLVDMTLMVGDDDVRDESLELGLLRRELVSRALPRATAGDDAYDEDDWCESKSSFHSADYSRGIDQGTTRS